MPTMVPPSPICIDGHQSRMRDEPETSEGMPSGPGGLRPLPLWAAASHPLPVTPSPSVTASHPVTLACSQYVGTQFPSDKFAAAMQTC